MNKLHAVLGTVKAIVIIAVLVTGGYALIEAGNYLHAGLVLGGRW